MTTYMMFQQWSDGKEDLGMKFRLCDWYYMAGQITGIGPIGRYDGLTGSYACNYMDDIFEGYRC